MSSTNRKNASQRNVADYYITPQPSIREFLSAFNQDMAMELNFDAFGLDNAFRILDPCAGGDETHSMAYPEAIQKFSGWNCCGMDTVDVRPDSRATYKEDYIFRAAPLRKYDMAITNPPFGIALDVIQKCLREVRQGGVVVMLLRLNFFGSQARSAWFKENMPTLCYVHSKRMKFSNTGGTDSVEYMHCCWVVGSYPQFTKLRIL